MFRLLRYFSFTSALAVIAVTTALVVFYRQSAISELVASAEAHNVSLARSFANTIWPDFAEYVSSIDEDGDRLRQRPETSQLHTVLAKLTDGLPVLKVKIYNLDGLTVYSSQASQMGDDKSGNAGFLTAKQEAKPASKLSFRDSFSAYSGVVENRDLVESYVPIRRADGTVEGVFELYTDVTPLVVRLERTMTGYIVAFLLIFTLLYGVLFVIVRHADGILKRQYLELEKSEENIQAKNISLEQEIDQRQKTESALRIAKEEAEAANRAKSEFLATVSHEVRTPMNGVLGMAGVLLDSELAENQREYVKVIQDSGESLMTLINDILDFSKIEAGKITLEEIDFDLVTAVDHVVDLLGHQAYSKGTELAAYLAPDVPQELTGDDGRIRQVLLNLVGNAIKFTKKGSVTVEVTVASGQFTAADLALRFAVSDTGIGISPEARERIFSEFTQADSSTTRSYGGTGLGLAICKNLVTLMGGEIGMDSEVGRGSEFWFTVPLKHHQSDRDNWAGCLSESIQGRRVLIVDDNDVIRRIYEKQLAALGMAVTGVADAETGLKSLRSAMEDGAPFEIAIIDHMMPGTDGVAFAGQIRGETALDIEVLILSSVSGQVDSDSKAQEIGFDAALPKPLCPGSLLSCLDGVLNRKATDSRKRGPTDSNSRSDQAAVFRILLAEDNTANQKVVIGMLTTSDFRVDAVANGLEAIEALQSRPYDLVLMDVSMPEMDGIEATRQVRRLAGPVAEVPIIAVTARAMDADKEICMTAGANDFITKPIQRAELIEKIEFWLGLTAPSSAEDEPKSGLAESRAPRPSKRKRKRSAS